MFGLFFFRVDCLGVGSGGVAGTMLGSGGGARELADVVTVSVMTGTRRRRNRRLRRITRPVGVFI